MHRKQKVTFRNCDPTHLNTWACDRNYKVSTDQLSSLRMEMEPFANLYIWREKYQNGNFANPMTIEEQYDQSSTCFCAYVLVDIICIALKLQCLCFEFFMKLVVFCFFDQLIASLRNLTFCTRCDYLCGHLNFVANFADSVLIKSLLLVSVLSC